MENEQDEALRALERVDAANSPYLATTPGEKWYHVALGVAAGTVVAAQGFSSPWSFLIPLAFVISIPVFISWWRREHGWWVSGFAGGQSSWATALTIVALGGTGIISFFANTLWVSIVSGVVAAVAVAGFGFLWMHLWRRGMRRLETA